MKLMYHHETSQALHYADSDPDEAARVLELAASYLKMNKEMPHELRWFLATAFELAMSQQPDKRNNALLMALKLKSPGRRPVKTQYLDHPGEAMQGLPDSGKSQNAAASQISVDYGISESTTVRL